MPGAETSHLGNSFAYMRQCTLASTYRATGLRTSYAMLDIFPLLMNPLIR